MLTRILRKILIRILHKIAMKRGVFLSKDIRRRGQSNTDKKEADKLRKIKTLRGKQHIDEAKKKGVLLIYRKAKPFTVTVGKFCIVRNKITGLESKVSDFRDGRDRSNEYEVVQNWKYVYYTYDFPKKAAYVIPNDIKEGEIVFVDDLIENFLAYTYDQGQDERLSSSKAIWKNKDLHILYNPNTDCHRIYG